jgi:hypothetical protein
MSTYKFTKVGDDKLIEIWQKKIKEQEQRHKKIIKEILNDVDNMSKEFDKTYKTLDEKQNSLEESLKIINSMK